MGKQISQYDKIIKENIEAVIPGLLQNILGIIADSSEELPDDIQHTKERKPDVLKKITDIQGSTFVLHLEFQLIDEPDMIYRMAEYYIMLTRKYKLPIRQFVIFLGPNAPLMPTRINHEWLTFRFSVISFGQLDYRIFLKADHPEEIVFGILCNFNGERSEWVIKQILHRLEETTISDFALNRYFSQLRVLAQLRNLEGILKDLAMDSIAKFVSMERDAVYLIGLDKGEAKGEAKAEERIVRNLLIKMSLTIEQIADVAGVSVEFVKDIEQKVAAGK